MTDREKKLLTYFIYRPNMYLGETNKFSIISFVHGLEFGQLIYGEDGSKSFSSALSKLLEDNYRIKGDAIGWSYQVGRYADKKDIPFSEAFLELAKILFPNPPTEIQNSYVYNIFLS
jgi:hypothetical protein